MKVLLTGASGFLGSHVLPLLLEKHDVRVFVRKPISFDVEVFCGDLMNKDDVKRAVKGVDVVVNLAGIVHQKEQKFWDVHVKAVENIVRHSSKVVHVSALWASPAGNAYQRSKWWGEQAVRLAESYVIIRPSAMFGINDTFINRILPVMKKYPFIPFFKGRVSPVFVGDVAGVIVKSVEELEKKVVSLCGPRSFTIEELFRLVAQIFEIKKPFVKVPFFFLGLYAYLNEFLPNPAFPKAFLTMLREAEPECMRMPTDFGEFLKENKGYF
jgi:NADH dehydrogenase